MILNIKFLHIVVALYLVNSINCDETSDAVVPAMTTQEPLVDTDSTVSENSSDDGKDIVDELNGLGNNTCHKFKQCSDCVLGDCAWANCGDPEKNSSAASCMATNAQPDSCTNLDCKNAADNCTSYLDCEQCIAAPSNCSFASCGGDEGTPECMLSPSDTCKVHLCDSVTTAAPNNGTTIDPTTLAPTTIAPTTPEPTTIVPTTTNPDNGTTPPPPIPTPDSNVTTPAPAPPTTDVPPPITTTTAAPPPAAGGFSAGSFFGGIALTVSLIGIGFGGYKYYKLRYDVNYRTL